ncbi:MAG: hypothetical protein A2W18_14755 [Candidatus Muproteobacteria bacterium RBG_16_60_9]|uniref:Uncharacterized protein n=1 Tax=Candidatus Muproteobacteria bacterium RBG_16_60_9 TaxID=1817755 RepID=A0A1F6UX00_9PROT|nr:MAG: hypothetical protein A2W18_14755 [Candidatus Muproteobacteria bacterium RBG_16_60_9]
MRALGVQGSAAQVELDGTDTPPLLKARTATHTCVPTPMAATTSFEVSCVEGLAGFQPPAPLLSVLTSVFAVF